MTDKTVKEPKENKKEPQVKKQAKKQEGKRILYELVNEHETRNYLIYGALAQAGILDQYEDEAKRYGTEIIEATITPSELNQIIKNFIG